MSSVVDLALLEIWHGLDGCQMLLADLLFRISLRSIWTYTVYIFATKSELGIKTVLSDSVEHKVPQDATRIAGHMELGSILSILRSGTKRIGGTPWQRWSVRIFQLELFQSHEIHGLVIERAEIVTWRHILHVNICSRLGSQRVRPFRGQDLPLASEEEVAVARGLV